MRDVTNPKKKILKKEQKKKKLKISFSFLSIFILKQNIDTISSSFVIKDVLKLKKKGSTFLLSF
jgi:hypothetical protein